MKKLPALQTPNWAMQQELHTRGELDFIINNDIFSDDSNKNMLNEIGVYESFSSLLENNVLNEGHIIRFDTFKQEKTPIIIKEKRITVFAKRGIILEGSDTYSTAFKVSANGFKLSDIESIKFNILVEYNNTDKGYSFVERCVMAEPTGKTPSIVKNESTDKTSVEESCNIIFKKELV